LKRMIENGYTVNQCKILVSWWSSNKRSWLH
jgi:predicted Ser/Thr protein kinase